MESRDIEMSEYGIEKEERKQKGDEKIMKGEIHEYGIDKR